MNVTSPTYVANEHQIEIGVSIDGEPDSTLLVTRHSAEGDGDYSSTVLGNLEEGRLSKIEVLERRITPTTVVIGESKIWWAEVCGSNYNRTRETPPGVVIALHLVA